MMPLCVQAYGCTARRKTKEAKAMTNRKTTTTNETAARRYTARRNDIAGLLS